MPPKARNSTAGPPPGDGEPGQPRPRGKPRGIRRDRDCITCKTRGLKCDLNRPQCLPCVQAGIACGGYPLRVVWLDERRRGSGSAKAAPAHPPAYSNSSSSPSVSLPSQSQLVFSSQSHPHPHHPQSHLSHSSSHLSSQSSLPASLQHHQTPLPSLPTISSVTNPSSYAPTSAPYSTSPTITFTQAPPINSNSLCSSPDEVPVASPAGPSSLTSSRTPPSVTSPSVNGSITSTAADEAWCETDQNSLIKRLAALCSHILTTEDINTAPKNHYLAKPETTSLLSDLCIFIQARMEGRNPPAIEHDDQHLLEPNTNKPPESLDMVRSRLTALAQVNRAIEAANPFAFLGIATFAVFEVCDDTFGEWQCHLHGARHLLEYHRCRTLADLQRMAQLVPGLMDILARLVWFDLSGSVVRGSVVNGSFTTPLIFEDWHRHVLLDASIYETVGITADTCALYVDVAKARLVGRPVQACLRAAEQILKVDERASGGHLSDWSLATNVHRCAAALAVLGQLQESQDQLAAKNGGMQDPDMLEDRAAWEATTHAAVDKLCSALAATPASSPFYIHLAVGAYMAGMRARTPEHCAVVRQYWLNCNISGISRYPGGLSRCSEHWRRVGLMDDAPPTPIMSKSRT